MNVGSLNFLANVGWRYCGVIICVWTGLGLIFTAVFYFPPPRPNTKGMSRAEIVREIDFVGGLLSIGGMVLFMAGMQVCFDCFVSMFPI